MTQPPIPPLHRSISVSWAPEAAFDRFTRDFGKWWPHRTHSIGEKLIKQVVFEPRVGGRIFEELVDGRRFLWGTVVAWEPPRGVKFTWHPAQNAEAGQDVELRFIPEGSGTRLELISTGWERLGEKARGARRGYDVGWGYVLNVWAGRRTAGMLAMDGVVLVLRLVQFLKGGLHKAIANAPGAMQPDPAQRPGSPVS